ncbi:MAG: peptidase domain-containing ABC transporter [Telluria sp.]
MKTILQTESSECGLACLAMIACHYGHHVELSELRRRFSVSLKGVSLPNLIRYAATLNLSARALRLDLDAVGDLQLPCIVHWNLNHFVVLRKVRRSWRGHTIVTILDPASGERVMPLDEFSRSFTGIAAELAPTPAFEVREEARRVSISELTGEVRGLRGAVAQVIALALALELFALVQPLFNQFVIDDVIVSGDMDLMLVLVFGFGLVLATRTAIDLARSWVLMRWGMQVGLQWSLRLFSHLTRLPMSYFEKRHLGDIVSRFGSIGTIQGTLTSLFVESLLDGLMALLALGMMTLYSGMLALVVVLSVAGYGLLRWLFYAPLRDASKERLVLAAKENTHFLETVRAMSTLKLFGREAERRAIWQNLKIDVNNRDIRTQKLAIVFRMLNTAIAGVQMLVVFYIGARLVTMNVLTVGMLMAFTSYSTTFSSRLFSVIDVLVNVKMLGLHAERLGDIVGTAVEPEVQLETDVRRITPSITLRGVKFRYGDAEPWVLDGIDLEIQAGDNVALAGASGCGKTTLCKIIVGLLEPVEGEVLIGGIPLRQLGLRTYRQMIGTVMQDDVLLSGSLLENISFFDSSADLERVQQCAQMAAIHDEIVAMPMGYQTLVGEMGSSLSGGQKQRVLLARALYKQPMILALDEATSALDLANERKVNAALAELRLTRISVAHRPDTMRAARRVITLSGGTVVNDREQVPLANVAA